MFLYLDLRRGNYVYCICHKCFYIQTCVEATVTWTCPSRGPLGGAVGWSPRMWAVPRAAAVSGGAGARPRATVTLALSTTLANTRSCVWLTRASNLTLTLSSPLVGKHTVKSSKMDLRFYFNCLEISSSYL